jgi:copper chaperone CopZ
MALEIPDLKTSEHVTTVVAALLKLPGVKSAIIDLNTRLAVVDYQCGVADLPKCLSACVEAGFPATEYHVESRFPKPIKIKGG